MSRSRNQKVRETVRGRLNATAKARRDAVAKARKHLPSYTDEDVEEITGKYAALSATAAAKATAEALTQHRETPESKPTDELAQVAGIAWKHRAKMSTLLASVIGAGMALWRWFRT
jgi:hypothetical protein